MRSWVPLLVLLVALPAFGRDWAHAECQDDYDTCRENCTIAFATSLDQHGKLVACLHDCRAKADHCTVERFQATHAQLPKPEPKRVAAPAPPPPPPPPSGPVHLVSTSPDSSPPAASTASAPPPPRSSPTSFASPTDPPPSEAPPPDAMAAAPSSPATPVPTEAETHAPATEASLPAPPRDAVSRFDEKFDIPPAQTASSRKPEPADAGIPQWKRKDLSVWEPGALD